MNPSSKTCIKLRSYLNGYYTKFSPWFRKVFCLNILSTCATHSGYGKDVEWEWICWMFFHGNASPQHEPFDVHTHHAANESMTVIKDFCKNYLHCY